MIADSIRASRIARAWRDGGVALVARRAARTVLSPVAEFGHVEFFVKGLTGDPPGTKVVDGIVIAEETPAAADRLLMGRKGAEAVAREIRKRFERGDRCIVARDPDGRYLHSRWLSTRPTYVPEIGLCIAPRQTQVYMYDGYTHADARGRGIDGAVRSFIFHQAATEGYREVVSYVHGSNQVGLAAARKWQRPVGRVGYTRFGSARPRAKADTELGARVDLISVAEAAEREAQRDERQRALKQWFESWLVEPGDKRSTGCSALPPAYFESAGTHIVEVLQLDPTCDEVLDVGCSSGGISRHVAPSCRRFVGVDMTAGLVADIEPGSIRTASGEPAAFSAADGRALPFADGHFDKVYCTGVIHVVPEHGDALRIVDELVRVCRPGGKVLVGAVPDAAKRGAEFRLLWRRSGAKGRARLVAGVLLPKRVRRALKRWAGAADREGSEVEFLKFDLAAMCRSYEARGLGCNVLDYPADYWSEDFRTTRTNLLIEIPNPASP